MIHETVEGHKSRFGINYWFPRDNPTVCRIVFVVPLFVWYSFGYDDFGNTYRGFRFLTLWLRYRLRNKDFFSGGTKLNLVNIGVFVTEGKRWLVETLEQKEDRLSLQKG